MNSKKFFGLIALLTIPVIFGCSSPKVLYQPIQARESQFKGYNTSAEITSITLPKNLDDINDDGTIKRGVEKIRRRIKIYRSTKESQYGSICAIKTGDEKNKPWYVEISSCSKKDNQYLIDLADDQQFIEEAFDYTMKYGTPKQKRLGTIFVQEKDGSISKQVNP